MNPVRRWARRFLIAGAGVILVLLGLLASLQLSPIATWLGRRLASLAPLAPGAELGIGRVTGNWVSGLTVEGLVLRREGRELARVRELRVSYDPRQLASPDRRLGELTLDGVRVHARRDSAGWDIARVLRQSEDTTGGGSFGIDRLVLSDVAGDAELTRDSVIRVQDLGLRARNLLLGDTPTALLDTVHARVLAPSDPPLPVDVAGRGEATREVFRLDTLLIASARSRIAGHAVLPRRLDQPAIVDQLTAQLSAAPLALQDLAGFGQPVPTEGELTLEARVESEGGRAIGTFHARLGEARADLEGSALVGTDVPADYVVRGTVRDLDPQRLLTTLPTGALNLDLELEARGPRLSVADGKGDIRVTSSRVGETVIDNLHLRADLDSGRADVRLRGSVAEVGVKASGWIRPFDSLPSYRLAGTASHLPGTDSLVRRLAGAEGDPFMEAGFSLSGHGFSVAEARVTGRADLTAVRSGGGRTSLGHATLTLADRRIDARPVLLVAGGRVSAKLTAGLDEPVTYDLSHGIIDSVDLGPLMGDTVRSPVSGRFTLRGRGTEPALASAVAALSLDHVRYGARRVDDVRADVRVDQGRGRLDLRGRLQGGTLSVEATGRPFDPVPAFVITRAALDTVDLGTLLGRPDLAGSVTARLNGKGRWSETARAFDGRLAVEPSRLGHLEVASGDVALALDGEHLRYDGTLVSSAGAIRLAGEGRPTAEVPSLIVQTGRMDSLDLGVLLNRPGLVTRLDGTFTASAEGTAPDSMRARLVLDLLPSRVNQEEIDSGRADFTLDRGSLRGELRVDAADGHLASRVQGSTIGGQHQVDAGATLQVERLDRWIGNRERTGRLLGEFSLQGAADSAGLTSLAGTITANGALDSARLDTLRVALSHSPGGVRVDTVVVRSNVAVMDGGGQLALRDGAGADTLRLAAVLTDFAPIASLGVVDSLSLDSARAHLLVTGGPALRRIQAEGEVRRLLYRRNHLERLTLNAGAAVDSTGLAGTSGEVELQGGTFGALLVRQARLAGRYDSVVALEANVLLRDSIALDAALQGTAAGDTVEGVLSRLDLSEGGREWSLAHTARVSLRPRRVEVRGFDFRTTDHRIALDGLLDRSGTSDAKLEIRQLDLDFLRRLGFSPVGGTLDADVRLAGPAESPSLQGKVLAVIRPEGRGNPGRITSELDWTTTGLRIDGQAAYERGGQLKVTGTLPLRLTLAPKDTASTVDVTGQPDDTLGVVIRADSLDLAFAQPFLPPGTAEGLTGKVAADGSIAGTMKSPVVMGAIRVTGFGASLPTLGVRYREGELAGRLADDRFQLERLHIVTDNDGELTVQGSVDLSPLDDPSLDLTADLREFRVSHSPTLRAIASGKLRLEGTAAKPVMTGDLRLGRTDVYAGAESPAATEVEQVELTPEELQRLAREFGPSVLARADERVQLVDRFKLDVDVQLPERVWFRSRQTPRMDLEIAGRMKVKQEPGQPMQFFGRVEPLPGRGSIELYSRTFRIVDGEITLDGPAEAATLDVLVEYQVPTQADPGDEGVVINVAATGRADSLKLDFTSEPTMSQDDIVSYIVTGRPSSENPLTGGGGGPGAGESAAAVGADIALARLSAGVSGAASETFGLDVFQIRQDGLRGLTLTAGRYVAPRVFLSLQQPIQLTSEALSSGSTFGPGFELEYTASRRIRANVRGGNVPPRLFFRGRYAF